MQVLSGMIIPRASSYKKLLVNKRSVHVLLCENSNRLILCECRRLLLHILLGSLEGIDWTR